MGPRTVWTNAKNLASTGIRSPDVEGESKENLKSLYLYKYLRFSFDSPSYNVELKIPLSGGLAARARVGTCLHSFHLLQWRPLRPINGAGCVFKTAAIN